MLQEDVRHLAGLIPNDLSPTLFSLFPSFRPAYAAAVSQSVLPERHVLPSFHVRWRLSRMCVPLLLRSDLSLVIRHL